MHFVVLNGPENMFYIKAIMSHKNINTKKFMLMLNTMTKDLNIFKELVKLLFYQTSKYLA